MRIILSRKGFDSACGGVPSPIFPDGKLCTLPIPYPGSGIRYSQVKWNGTDLGTLVEQLTQRRIQGDHEVHLDPDLNPLSVPRQPGWRGLFGQIKAAKTHLATEGVSAGDLFLFFGWFRRVDTLSGRLTYVRGAPQLHVLFGWLQVGSVETVAAFPEGDRQWADYHPHFRKPLASISALYVASDTLRLPGLKVKLPGAGMFPAFKPALCPTAPSASRSIWQLPRWFYPDGGKKALSCHSDPSRWQLNGDSVYLRTVSRGQEFVLDCDGYPESGEWLAGLFEEAMA